MELTWQTFAVVCPLVFLGGFMDAVAGGGGIITLPAYMFAGVPIHMAYGTNKFGNSFGTAIATFNYGRGGFIRWRPGFVCAAMSLIGSWLGARLVVALSARTIAVLYNDPVACCRCFYDSKPEYRKRRERGANRPKFVCSQRPDRFDHRWL